MPSAVALRPTHWRKRKRAAISPEQAAIQQRITRLLASETAHRKPAPISLAKVRLAPER